jgi:beta-alanine--pyruvate transaminase
MGAVAASEAVWRIIAEHAQQETIELFHGYTFSAHPVATAAALAAFDIYEREALFDRATRLSPYFLDRVFELADMPIVTDVRGYGLLAAFDLAPDGAPGARGYACLKRLFQEGLLIKWTGDTGIIAPPLITEPQHIDEIVDALRRGLAAL